MLERIPLGTPYPEVTARVAEVTHARALAAGTRHLAVDATGVGRPVVDLLRRARPAATLMPVVVTPGERQSLVGDTYHVPKRDVITGLVVLFQQGLLQIARGLPHAATLVAELRAMQVRTPGPGREQWGAWRPGTHDDLVFAVALACWAAGQVYPAKRNEWWTNRREAEAARCSGRRWRAGRDRITLSCAATENERAL